MMSLQVLPALSGMQSDPQGKEAFREEGSGGGALCSSNVQLQLKPEAHLTGARLR